MESHDPELNARLTQLDVKAEYYGIRWLTMLLAQDFELPELLRIWDTMLAVGCRTVPGTGPETAADGSPGAAEGAPRGTFSALGLDFVENFCCGMILRQRRQLLDASFERCLELLQVCENSCTTGSPSSFLSCLVGFMAGYRRRRRRSPAGCRYRRATETGWPRGRPTVGWRGTAA